MAAGEGKFVLSRL